MACEAGTAAIGLNFYPRSKRYVEVDVARGIAKATTEKVAIFGVFVNASPEEICSCAQKVGLSHVQLHGDEPIEIVAQLRERLKDTKIVRGS